MTVPIPAVQETPETAEILRFLHRFAELMSRGSNSENLLRAAQLLETQMDLVKESNELLSVERARGDAGSQLRKALEDKLAGLESEMTVLKSQLSECQLKLNEVTVEAEAKQNEAETKQGELLRRAEEAERSLAAAHDELARSSATDTHVRVPVTSLRLAKAQFESLACAFEKAGNIVSQVMCEASATSLERVLVDAGAAEAESRSRHAA
jgi:chromosome segregation ATPase